MSYLSEKFDLPEVKVKEMINKGVISSSWAGYEDVIRLHKQGMSMFDIAVETGRSKTGVYEIIRKYRNL